jgi:hypothetical protein
VWLRVEANDDDEADAPMDLLDPTMARRVTTQVCVWVGGVTGHGALVTGYWADDARGKL